MAELSVITLVFSIIMFIIAALIIIFSGLIFFEKTKYLDSYNQIRENDKKHAKISRQVNLFFQFTLFHIKVHGFFCPAFVAGYSFLAGLQAPGILVLLI